MIGFCSKKTAADHRMERGRRVKATETNGKGGSTAAAICAFDIGVIFLVFFVTYVFFIKRFWSKQTMSVYVLVGQRVTYRLLLIFTHLIIFPVPPVYSIVVSNALF